MREQKVTLLHGAGGEAMQELLRLIMSGFSCPDAGGIGLRELDDGATIPLPGAWAGKHLVFTTDSHVVKPIFFPGGDIGRLSVAGTVNDLAVMGARPWALSSGLIIEEGFLVEYLERIIRSMDQALAEAELPLVTGDTKVMPQGELDGIVINTTGIGIAEQVITDCGLSPGDKLIITGSVGDHGMALLTAREGLEFETDLSSDVAPINGLIAEALKVGGITAMKDPTRGGLAMALNELARKSEVGLEVYEDRIPVKEEVRGLSEVLGISPLEMANEGKALIGTEPEKAEAILEALQRHPQGREAALIGEATTGYIGRVIMETAIGGRRFLEAPLGDPVPRIC